MWLSETAVDTPTLEVLAAAGLRFTILAPSQAEAVSGDIELGARARAGDVQTVSGDIHFGPGGRLDSAETVSGDIRLIVHKTEGSMLLCYVDHHDKAYAWAVTDRFMSRPPPTASSGWAAIP